MGKRVGKDQARKSGEQLIGDGSEEKADLIGAIIHKIENQLKDGNVKATVADYIRLLQLQKEYYGDEPRQVVVRWIEPTETESVPEE